MSESIGGESEASSIGDDGVKAEAESLGLHGPILGLAMALGLELRGSTNAAT